MPKKQKESNQIIPQAELKAERFIRVVAPRVTKAVKAIKDIGYCAASSYEYTPEQAKQIIDTLGIAVVNLESQFAIKAKAEDQFVFSDT